MKFKLMIIVAVGIIGCILFLIYVLRSKTEDVSKQEPYIYLLKGDLITKKEIIVIENTSLLSLKNDFQKEISSQERTDTSEVAYIKMPIGSVIRFTKALHYENGTSGIKYAILLGTIKKGISNETLKVVYTYGYFKTLCATEPCNYWEYKKDLW
jgi:hypothetical protein